MMERLEVNPFADQGAEDLNHDMALMVKEITRIGPRVPEIARRLGRHKETVRYWYKKLQEHNFGIQAEVNNESMGLRRIIFKVKFGETYEPHIRPLMFVMADLAYVVGYSKTMPGDDYVINASVPAERTQEYLDFFEQLSREGIFSEMDYTLHSNHRNIPMRTDRYDFMHGRWNYDSPSRAQPAPFLQSLVAPHPKLDKVDLLLAKELSIDATREMQQVQKSIWDNDHVEVNYKTLCWHLNEHVERNGLIRGYKVNWMGTHYDVNSGRDLRPQHTYTGSELFVKRPTIQEMTEITRRMRELPVVWSENVGRDYHAQIAIPNELMVETLQFIQDVVQPVRQKSDFYMIDMRHSASFTMPYKLYDEESRSWQFNKQELLAKFAEFIVQVRNSQ